MTLQTPTGSELRASWREDNDDFELVHEDTGPDDHGYSYTRVFRRVADDTYWEIIGVNQGGGDYDTLRDDPEYITVSRVFPKQKTITEYVTEKVAQAAEALFPAPTPLPA